MSILLSNLAHEVMFWLREQLEEFDEKNETNQVFWTILPTFLVIFFSYQLRLAE